LIQNEGKFLAMIPYKKRDFRSHKVSPDVYGGINGMEVSSLKLCQIISKMYQWDCNKSYRVPGLVLNDHSAVVFNLGQAEIINP